MKELNCGSFLPGCDWRVMAETDSEVIRRACQHLRAVHGHAVITRSMLRAMKQQIVDTDVVLVRAQPEAPALRA